jgi:uncharacterized delta-60 repeat protein
MRNIFTLLLLFVFFATKAQDGVLDPFWGNIGNGTTLAPVSGPPGVLSQTSLQKIILLSNGYTLQTFTASNGTNQDFGLARFDADGNLDLSFGGSGTGYIKTDFGGDDFANSMVIQSSGKIVVVGYSEVLGDASFALARYNANGTPDNTFGTGGKTTTTIGTDNLAYDVALAGGDKLVIAGAVYNGFNYLATLAQYTADGALDAANFNPGNGFVFLSPPGAVAAFSAVVVKADGSIIAGGRNSDAVDYDFLLAKYSSTGVLDAGFAGGAGYVLTDFGLGRDDQAYDLALDATGNIYLGGYTDKGTGATPNNDFALAKYSAAGVPDGAFGSGGLVTSDFGANEISYALAVQSDGKVVLAGTRYSGSYPGADNDFAIERFTSGGTPDLLFGGNNTGKNTIDFGGNDPGLSMAIGTGYIMLGGVNGAGAGALNNLALARLINTSTPLPITLLSFTGARQNNAILLNWKTLEQDVSAYEIERSGDGRNFTKLGSVSSLGNTNTARDYTFSDMQPLPNVNVYRLKIINTNGTVAFSYLVIVRSVGKADVQAFPNPVHTQLYLQLNAAPGTLYIQVADVAGRIVRQIQLSSSGTTISTSVDMRNLQQGIYFVRVNNETIRVIKE